MKDPANFPLRVKRLSEYSSQSGTSPRKRRRRTAESDESFVQRIEVPSLGYHAAVEVVSNVHASPSAARAPWPAPPGVWRRIRNLLFGVWNRQSPHRPQPVDAYHSGGNDEEQNGDQEVGPEAAVETTPTREAPRILFSAPAVVQCSGTDMQHTRALLHSHRETLHGAMDQLRRALLKYMEQQVAPEFTGIAEQTKSMATAVDRVEELSTAAMEAAHQARANANGTSATMRRFQRVAEARLLGIETRLREFESVVQRSTDANNALRGQVEELLNMLLTSGPGSPVTPLPGPLPSPRSMSPDPYGGSLEAQQEAVDSTIAEVDQKLGRVHQESSKRRAQHSALDE